MNMRCAGSAIVVVTEAGGRWSLRVTKDIGIHL
jgi:hypothetical protein